MMKHNEILNNHLNKEKIHLCMYEFNQKVLQLLRTISLIHSRGTTAPKFDIRWTLRTIFANGTILATFSPLCNDHKSL